MSSFRVLIAGAGMGGLCLAQMLRYAQIDVQVFERDPSPRHRRQGYRLHLNANGLVALNQSLPTELKRVFESTSMRTKSRISLLKTDLSILKNIIAQDDREPEDKLGSEQLHCNVDRMILREILLGGLDDVCHFGKELLSVNNDARGVKACFKDGTTAKGDVLVGADGINSMVRLKRAPAARPVSTGTLAIYGRIPIVQAKKLLPPAALEDIFVIASDARKVFLGMGAVIFPEPPKQAALRVPNLIVSEQSDYEACIVGGRHEFFNHGGALRERTSKELHAIALKSIESWPIEAIRAVSAADPDSFVAIDMYTSVPCNLDVPTNVTLLGDAIHAMSPALGRGANLAMRDAARLGKRLIAVARGESILVDALTQYETEMLSYSAGVVRESARIGHERMGQDLLPEK